MAVAFKVGLCLILAVVLMKSEAAPKHKKQLYRFPARPAKSSWPEVVGMRGEDAKAYIENEDPSLHVRINNEGDPITMDLRYDRVRVFVNKQGRVVGTPTVG